MRGHARDPVKTRVKGRSTLVLCLMPQPGAHFLWNLPPPPSIVSCCASPSPSPRVECIGLGLGRGRGGSGGAGRAVLTSAVLGLQLPELLTKHARVVLPGIRIVHALLAERLHDLHLIAEGLHGLVGLSGPLLRICPNALQLFPHLRHSPLCLHTSNLLLTQLLNSGAGSCDGSVFLGLDTRYDLLQLHHCRCCIRAHRTLALQLSLVLCGPGLCVLYAARQHIHAGLSFLFLGLHTREGALHADEVHVELLRLVLLRLIRVDAVVELLLQVGDGLVLLLRLGLLLVKFEVGGVQLSLEVGELAAQLGPVVLQGPASLLFQHQALPCLLELLLQLVFHVLQL
mmetsp:Transcript_1761/g.5103  ORF Transcript_1761/g.5103 Transcript_1761/m.5103 type:complete len:342 (-) Transcript_1761:962-1987(-)